MAAQHGRDGFLSFAGFEAASTLGEEATRPTRDIPRAILGTAIFGGIYFMVVTAVEMTGFGAGKAGVAAFANSPSLRGHFRHACYLWYLSPPPTQRTAAVT